MRKLDYLRRLAQKTKFNSNAVYDFNVAAFQKRGDYDAPYASPLFDKLGMYGVAIVHTICWEEEEEEPFFSTWRECFQFRKPFPITGEEGRFLLGI